MNRIKHFALLLWMLSINIGANSQVRTITYEDALADIEDLFARDELETIISRYGSIDSDHHFHQWSCIQQGRLLHKLGVSHYLLDQEYKAISVFTKIVDSIWQECNVSPQEKANTIYNIGISYQYTPDKQLGKTYILEALQILRQDNTNDLLDLADKSFGAGAYFEEIKDYQQAQDYLLMALEQYKKLPGTTLSQYEVLNRLIILALEFNTYDRASTYYEQANLMLQNPAISIPLRESAFIKLNAASAYLELQEYETSETLALEALQDISALDEPDLHANALETLAILAKRQGNYQEALSFINQVINIRLDTTGGNRHHYLAKSIAFENLAEIQYLTGNFQDALKSIDQAIEIISAPFSFDQDKNPIIADKFLADPIALLRQLNIKAKVKTKSSPAGDPNILPMDIYRKIDTLIGRSLVNLSEDRAQLELINLMAQHYHEALNYALALYGETQSVQYLEEAFRFADRSKALVLQRHLIESQTREDLLPAEIIFREKQLHTELNQLKDAILFGGGNKDSLRRQLLA